MNYSAIQFIKAKLPTKSQCLVFVGNNRWLQRQIRQKIEQEYSKAQFVDGKDEDSLSRVSDMAMTPPLLVGGTRKRFVHLSDANPAKVYKWLEGFEMSGKDCFLIIDFDQRKSWDWKAYKGQLKKLEKWKHDTTISSIDVTDPPAQTTKQIISLILQANKITDPKFVDSFYYRYKSNFDLCEENAKKIALRGGSLSDVDLDETDIVLSDVKTVINHWIDGDMVRTVQTLRRIKESTLNDYIVHMYLVKHLRQCLMALSHNRGNFMMLDRAKKKGLEWMSGAYHDLLKVDPFKKAYHERLMMCIVATFRALD